MRIVAWVVAGREISGVTSFTMEVCFIVVFVTVISNYLTFILSQNSETAFEESLNIWQKVFGDEVADTTKHMDGIAQAKAGA
jgi:hypothetical protein